MDLLIRYGADKSRMEEAAREPALTLGRVIAQHKELYGVITEAGERLCTLSGKLRHEAAGPEQLPAVGDFVLALPEGSISRVLPRRSVFTRTDPGNARLTQVVAANVDVVFVCMSLNQNYNLSRLERYLAVAWNSGATPVVLLTKADLCADPARIQAEVMAAAPGADVVFTHSEDEASWARVRAYVGPGVTAAFIGSSGVGKSTLINRLLGEARLNAAAIRADGKGRHTTTSRELIALPDGGLVIDTPGMRELGVEAVDLSRTFADIDALAAQCRFADCTHTSEPGCAVRAAIESGALEPRRLESYRKLRREARYEGLSGKALEAEKLGAMFEGVGGMKKVRQYIRQNDKRKGE